MKPQRLVVVAASGVAVAILSAGCSSNGAANTATPPRSTAPATTPAATPAGPPALGTTQTRTHSDGVTVAATVYHVRTINSHADIAGPGRRFVGVDAKVCVRSADGEPAPVSTQPWTVDYADDTSAKPIDEWWDGEFPVPLYPASRNVDSGRCVRGWVMFRPLKGQAVRVTYAPESGDNVSWRIH